MIYRTFRRGPWYVIKREIEYSDAEGDRRLRWFLDFNTDAEAIQFILRWS